MKIYVVRRGDSLYSIAKANASSVQELAAINELSDPARLSIGQAIVIPDGAVSYTHLTLPTKLEV